MLPLRFAGHWQTASIVLLVFVLIATLLPAFWLWPDNQELVSWVFGADKWLHGLTFAFLAIWFAGQYQPTAYWRIAMGLIAFGALIEICQSAIAYRSAEWFDMIANVIGIGVGLTIALIGVGGWCVWFENRFVPAGVNRRDD